MPLRPDCLAIVNNFAFLLGGEELGPDGEFHASSKVYRYDPRQNSWLRMADMSVPRLEEPRAPDVCRTAFFEQRGIIFLAVLSRCVHFKVILQMLTASQPTFF